MEENNWTNENFRQTNQKYLDEFVEWMKEQGLSEKTIHRHLSNTRFYINEYLGNRNQVSMEFGTNYISEYFSYFFIDKCMWSTPNSLKENVASLKKFYRCMTENGHIDEEDYEYMLYTIKMEKEEWIDRCGRYNDADYEWSGNDWFI